MTDPFTRHRAIKDLMAAGIVDREAEAIVAVITRECAPERARYPSKDQMRDEFAALAREMARDHAARNTRLLQWLFAAHALLLASIVGIARFTDLL
ncbi:hypothetical protein ACIPPQ_21245 [Sphingopyxis sp. LARHCG72]